MSVLDSGPILETIRRTRVVILMFLLLFIVFKLANLTFFFQCKFFRVISLLFVIFVKCMMAIFQLWVWLDVLKIGSRLACEGGDTKNQSISVLPSLRIPRSLVV